MNEQGRTDEHKAPGFPPVAEVSHEGDQSAGPRNARALFTEQRDQVKRQTPVWCHIE